MIGLTGSSGFIGSHFLKRLITKKKKVKILLRGRSKDSFNDVMTLHADGDLLNQDSLVSFCEDISTIVHIAGIVKGSKPKQVMSVNRDGTRNLLEQAEKKGVKRFLYVSSGAVDWLGGEYAQSKIEAEQLVRSSKLDWVITRPGEIYGPGDINGITSLIPKIKKWPFFPIIGDGSYLLQPLLVHDLVIALETCLDRFDKCQGKIIHLAGPKPISYRNIVEEIGNALNKKVRTITISPRFAIGLATLIRTVPGFSFVDKEQIRRVLISKYWDISCAEDLLDFNPVSFSEGIAQIIKTRR